MIESINTLLKTEFNKNNKAFALKRFIYWKIIRLLKLKNVAYPFWNGRKIYISADSFHSMWLMYNYIVDWEEFNFISKYIQENDQVCDIGSNLGLYTIWMSIFIKSGKIHSFEPDDVNYDRLTANIAVNSLSNIVSANKSIVSEVDGNLNFTTALDGENHIIDQSDIKTTLKKSIRLDTYTEKEHIADFKFIKIDTEGFELSVLKGAEKLLNKKKIKVIQLEINQGLINAKIKPAELLDYIFSKEYKLCRYNVSANQLYEVDYDQSIDNYFATFDIDNVNTYLLKN